MILEFALKSCNSDFSRALIIPFLSGYSMSNENQMDEVNKVRRIFCMLCVLSASIVCKFLIVWLVAQMGKAHYEKN